MYCPLRCVESIDVKNLVSGTQQMLSKHLLLLFIFITTTPTPWWLSGKESACGARDVGLIPGLGRSPGEGNGNSPQYSCLGNPMDRGV